MRTAFASILLPWLTLLLAACGDSSSSNQTSSSAGGSSSSSSGAGGGCSASPDAAATACAALVAFNGPGLSKSFKSGVITDVKPDGVTIDAGADGEVKLRWPVGDDLTPVFTVGDAVTGIEEGFSSQGYTGIETMKARAVVANSSSDTSISPPAPFTLAPGLSFAFTPECSWSQCEPGCTGLLITTTRSSLVVTVGGAPVALKTGETATVGGVVVHHGGTHEGSYSGSSPTCNFDFSNEGTFTLLQKL